jgi:folate-binding protein YgfZ
MVTPEDYAAARERASVARLAGRGVLEVSGPTQPRQKFLQGMLSNDVASLSPGAGCRAALLSPRGGILAFLRVLVEKDRVLLETPPERLDLVRRTLEHHRVGAPVRFAPRDCTVLALLGPEAGSVLRAAGAASVPSAPEAHLPTSMAGQPVLVVRASDLPVPGFVLHVPTVAADAIAGALEAEGARPLRSATLDTLRVEAMRPWYGPDVTEDNLLHETGLLAEYHSPTKGCYVGQEVVARLEGRGGHVNKALRGLRLAAPAAAGDPVVGGDREIGRVTTAAVSPRLGHVALAWVHRDHFAAGTSVTVGGKPATVVASFEEPST